jgi:phosphatidylserine/phosphatidylglycerophosphate/cardiolipin synthase-like enzyme
LCERAQVIAAVAAALRSRRRLYPFFADRAQEFDSTRARRLGLHSKLMIADPTINAATVSPNFRKAARVIVATVKPTNARRL